MRVLTTLPFDGIPPLSNGVQIERIMGLKDTQDIRSDIARAWSVSRQVGEADWLILDSTAGRFKTDVMAAIFLHLSPGKPNIIFFGSMFEPGTGARLMIDKTVLKIADWRIKEYIVQSTEELTTFPRLWSVDPKKMNLVPYFASVTYEEVEALRDVLDAPPTLDVFAGGNALRNYPAFLEAAAQFPDKKFFIATRRLDDYPDMPGNVTAHPTTHDDFMRNMASSRIVVTPIQSGLHRAAGQQTYLNAMFMGKLSVVNNEYGVADHIQDGVTGKIVDGTSDGYAEALRWAFDPANAEQVKAIGAAARQDVIDKYTYERYVERLSREISKIILGN